MLLCPRLHAAIMERLQVQPIISADADFDRLAQVERLDPARLGDWLDAIRPHEVIDSFEDTAER